MPTFAIRANRLIVFGFFGCLELLTPVWVRSQDSASPNTNAELEQRVHHLEEIIRRRQEEDHSAQEVLPPMNAVSPPPSNPGSDGSEGETRRLPVAGWDDGFYLRSEDKKYSLRITGQIQADYRHFLDEGDTTDINTFLVRRARLGIEATVFDHFEFRLLPDFGQSQPRIQDAYLNVRYWDAFQVEAGKFKQPISYEQLIQDRFVPTLERSLIDQLVPARDIGVMVHGQKLFGDRLDYAIAVSNGEQNGDADTNNQKDVAGRIAVRPFNGPFFRPWLRLLQIGISGGTGIEQEGILPATLRTPATVPWFSFNSGVQANGHRDRWSPEISYFFGPLGVAAQYFRMEQNIQAPPAGGLTPNPVTVPFDGYYVLTTFLLTGEERTTYGEAVTPLRPFDPHRPFSLWGAWELVARISRLEVGDVVFAPGPPRLANPALFSSVATELTVGFNWYLNKWVRVQMNWEHAWFDDPVRLGTGAGGLLKDQDTLLTRFQVIF